MTSHDTSTTQYDFLGEKRTAGAPLRGTRAAGTRSGRRATRDLVNGVNGECRDGPCWYNQQSQSTYLNAVSIALLNQHVKFMWIEYVKLSKINVDKLQGCASPL